MNNRYNINKYITKVAGATTIAGRTCELLILLID